MSNNDELKRGRVYYSDGKYTKAAVLFKQVANACACGIRVERVACTCGPASLQEAIDKRELEAGLRRVCTCAAKMGARCKSQAHAEALDSLTATYMVAANHSGRAMAVAESMVLLNPRNPKGYLRLAKLLETEKKYDTAYLTYEQGIRLVEAKNPDSDLLTHLRVKKTRLQSRALAKDPFKTLPTELVALIFKSVDFKTLCRATRVSKGWRQFLTKSGEAVIQDLWRVQKYHGYKNVTTPQLRRYNALSGSSVTHIHIDDISKCILDDAKLKWIISCPTLKALTLKTSRQMNATAYSATTPCRLRLSKLYLGVHVAIPPEFLRQILLSSADTLSELTILTVAKHDIRRVMKNIPLVLHNLKVLRLHSSNCSVPDFNMVFYVQLTPNVEEVHLDDLVIYNVGTWEASRDGWPKLKRLYMGDISSDLFSLDCLPFRLSADIEQLHLQSPLVAIPLLLHAWERDPTNFPDLKKLKTLMLNMLLNGFEDAWCDGKLLEVLVRPGFESGSLKELEISPFHYKTKDYPWFKSEHLTYFGVNQMSIAYPLDSQVEAALADAVDRFPNLQAVGTGQDGGRNHSLVGMLLRRGIKTVHYEGHYFDLEDYRKFARARLDGDVISEYYADNLPMHIEWRE